jgi:AcrR family transcriptional regulator
VPKNRSSVDREQKVAEILDAAEAALRNGGYESLSIAGLARRLGLAANSIYWYFPSKDELFVAAIRLMVQGILARKPPASRSLERRVLWFAEQLDELDDLRVDMYQRSKRSPAVAVLAEELRSGGREMASNTLRGAVADDQLETVAEALLATIDGTALRGLDPAQRRRVIAYSLRRFTA